MKLITLAMYAPAQSQDSRLESCAKRVNASLAASRTEGSASLTLDPSPGPGLTKHASRRASLRSGLVAVSRLAAEGTEVESEIPTLRVLCAVESGRGRRLTLGVSRLARLDVCAVKSRLGREGEGRCVDLGWVESC